jgi:hypothetical protein
VNEKGVKIFYMNPSNERGQAAVFVALMFNVLFVFFAMAINVGLVVHDKINLQNAADMAAYYAAMKQAELLNVIGHENYQIRQSWKLLAWRYHVLGTMGLYRGDPSPVWTGNLSDSVWDASIAPAVCVTYKPTWREVPEDESLCNTPNLHIPPLPEVKVIAGFLGINEGIAALSRQLRAQFDAQCEKHGAYNWWFAMGILHAFRLDQINRKRVMFALARDLSGQQAGGTFSTNGDFTDLDGNSVLQGAQATFLKNLTYANRAAFESGGGKFNLFNSLAGVDVRQWLVEIKILPEILYTDVDNSAGCNASTQIIQNLPQRPGAQALLLSQLNAAQLELWRFVEDFSDTDDHNFSLGVEKNPWYMAYMGVGVTTTPRQIFFPFGKGIEMKARSYAKPFGGRIGPWYQSQWDSGSPTSGGTNVDPLLPPRVQAGGLMNSADPKLRLPNYSRYPGDQLGLTSYLGVNSLSGLASLGISFGFYGGIYADIAPGNANDVLAWDALGNGAPDVRQFEIQALAPDLFDITYYSIEPNYSKNYFEKLLANGAALGVPSTEPIRPDLGFSPLLPEYSVQDQLALARQRGSQRPEAFYFVRDKTNLLTSWLPGPGAFNYDVAGALNNFGKCALPDDGMKYTTPGSCVAGGGRTGVSVKLVARDALLSGQHKIGGPGAAPGPILNPPKTADGW